MKYFTDSTGNPIKVFAVVTFRNCIYGLVERRDCHLHPMFISELHRLDGSLKTLYLDPIYKELMEDEPRYKFHYGWRELKDNVEVTPKNNAYVRELKKEDESYLE